MLKEQEVRKMFDEEAVLIGADNVVPMYKAKELFGEKAAEFAFRFNEFAYSGGFGIGYYTVMCLKYKGFQIAATYCNVEEIREIETLGNMGKDKRR